jgi:hypothetical protein
MSKTSAKLGSGTSGPEVTHVSPLGIWLLVEGRELFMSFEKFPWFRSATVAAIYSVEQPHPRHLYWPELDIDLAVESIEHPERFPLIASG